MEADCGVVSIRALAMDVDIWVMNVLGVPQTASSVAMADPWLEGMPGGISIGVSFIPPFL